jgi:hypothetical protein
MFPECSWMFHCEQPTLSRGWSLRSRGWSLLTRGWSLLTRGWSLLTRGWSLLTRGWSLLTRGWTLLTRGWSLLTRGWTLLTRGWTLLTRGWSLLTRGWTLLRLVSTTESGWTLSQSYERPTLSQVSEAASSMLQVFIENSTIDLCQKANPYLRFMRVVRRCSLMIRECTLTLT